MERVERELRLYRRLCLLVGAVYLVWWAAVVAMLPDAYNPLLGRLIVVVSIWTVAVASYASAWVRQHLRLLWMCGLWLLTAHYFYLFYRNASDINWVVGSFITVTAVSLGLMSRASLFAYSIFAAALAITLAIVIPALRESVFVLGLMTVLLQANVGLNSRLGVLRDLAASNEHFQLLFDSTFEGVLIHEGGRIVQVNASLIRLLQSPRDDLVGSEVLTLIHPDDRAAARDLLQGTSEPLELRCARTDGSSVDVEVRAKPFAHSEPAQQLITISDVSERKQRAEELRQTNEALARSNVDLQRFASVASHDLQTPLRSIASFVELLQSTYGTTLDAQANDWLSRTSHSVDHLRTLIRDLLEYSRVDVEARTFERVAMREAFAAASSLLDASVQEAKATITTSELPYVDGDRSQLVQLLMNLLGNAIKYRGSDAPRVHLEAREREHDWLFEVRDNGIGIASKYQEQVFDIFKRLHSQKEYPGTGIGLAICRRVVDRHGGKIWVESKPGEGSSFFFTIAKEERPR